MADLTCDVAVIGAGTAGRAAERSARRHGAATLLFDESFAGTTCVAVGCMPSKLLIAAADAAEAVRRASVFGVEAGELRVDGAAVMRRVRAMRDEFLSSDRQSLEDLPEDVAVKARARFVGPTRLKLNDGRCVDAKAVVIATGSSPGMPEAFATVADRILTNETVFELPDLPRSFAVIGAGPLGLELAQAFARLGVSVAVFDQGTTIAGLTDGEVEQDLRRILERDVPITTGVEMQAEPTPDGVRLSWTGGSKGSRAFERMLVSAGRPPRLKGLGLEAAGFDLDEHGTPLFDRATLQCGASPVFIAGDADHDQPVLHEAADEGTIAGRNAATFPRVEPAARGVPFSLMFTDPSVAVIGRVPEPDAADVVIGRASYADQGRAKVMAVNAGTVRLYASRPDGRLTGATMAGPAVEHTAHLVAWAVEAKQTAGDLLDRPFYHPTFEEGLKPALREICQALETEAPTRDDARPAAP